MFKGENQTRQKNNLLCDDIKECYQRKTGDLGTSAS